MELHLYIDYNRKSGLGNILYLTQYEWPLSYISAAQTLQQLQEGNDLVKVRGRGKKYKRSFKIDKDFLSFSYDNSKKWFTRNDDMSKGEYKGQCTCNKNPC